VGERDEALYPDRSGTLDGAGGVEKPLYAFRHSLMTAQL
jgi:hypothetical protein